MHLQPNMDQLGKVLIPAASINVGQRIRKDLGDIEDLAASIKEVGLIQPIVLDSKLNLVAGGRRYAAMTMLGWTEFPCVFMGNLTESQLRLCELEENERRKAMTWQEKALSVITTHRLKTKEHSGQWDQADTAQLVGYDRSYVTYCMQLAKHLADEQSPIYKADDLASAIKLLARQRESEAEKELAKRTIIAPATSSVVDRVLSDLHKGDAPTSAPSEKMVVSLTNIVLANSIDWMNSNPDSCHHIVCDPPYGIDMANFVQTNTGMENIQAIELTHKVEENYELFDNMLPAMHNCLRDSGYVIFWCDFDNWEMLKFKAEFFGFTVQRWPLTWVKTHQCMNQMAHVNFTKNTEIAMVLRKGKAKLPRPVQTSVIICSNDDDKIALGHPFVKPFELWKFCIESVSIQGETILDPFAGVGSSTMAALKLGRKPIAVEIDESFHAKLLERVKAFYTEKIPNVEFTI